MRGGSVPDLSGKPQAFSGTIAVRAQHHDPAAGKRAEKICNGSLPELLRAQSLTYDCGDAYLPVAQGTENSSTRHAKIHV
jgi:hypothetical protein